MADRVQPVTDISKPDLQNKASGESAQFAEKRDAAIAANSNGNTASGRAPQTRTPTDLLVET